MKISVRDEIVKEFLARYPNRTAAEAMAVALAELNVLDQLLDQGVIRSHISTSLKSSEESQPQEPPKRQRRTRRKSTR